MRWSELEQQEPELAAAVRARFDAHRHLTMATLRRDGSPRITGTEVVLWEGDLWLAGMSGARRHADLRRDPRLAVHSGSDDPPGWVGDAKVSGRAVEVLDGATRDRFAAGLPEPPPGPFELFRLDVGEAVHVALGEPADHVVVTSWVEGRGVQRTARA